MSETPRVALAPVPRLALNPHEAAEAIGVKLTFFQEEVQPELQVVRKGRKRLIPVPELERWLERNKAPTPDPSSKEEPPCR